MIDVTCT